MLRFRLVVAPRPAVVFAIGLAALAGCATLQQVAALRKVDFAIDRVTGVSVAGVQVQGKRSYRDLSAVETARLAAAVVARRAPLSFVTHVAAENPGSNTVTARLIQMDWTAYIEDQPTVSGRLDREYLLPPGQMVDIPITVELELFDFFNGRAADIFQLARAVAGIGGPTNVSFKARPTINTPIGPIRYPGEITIVSRDVGGGNAPPP